MRRLIDLFSHLKLSKWLAIMLAVYAVWLVGRFSKLMGIATWNLGSILGPTNYYAAYLLLVVTLGTFAVLVGTWGGQGLLAPHYETIGKKLSSISDRYWLLLFSGTAFLIATGIRIAVLDFSQVSDDEAAYLFSADVLLSGKLYAPAPETPLFWERAFLTIDGDKWYSQYFLGWPAVLAVFRALELQDVASAFCFSLTLPFVFRGTMQATGSRYAAYCATLLLLLSPMLLVGSATMMSHACCLLFLAILFCLVAGAKKDAQWARARAFGIAVTFCVAFFVRPQTTIGLGGALVLTWLASRWPWRDQLAQLTCFAIPSLVGAALFLYVNFALTGNALEPAYSRLLDVLVDKGMRFGHLPQNYDVSTADLKFDVLRGFTYVPLGLLRLVFAGLGLPLLVLFVVCARGKWACVTLGMVVGFYLLQWFSNTPGIDTFGPVHLYELMLPLVLGVALGLTQARSRFGETISVLFAITMIVSFFAYTTSRLENVANLADGANDTVQRVNSYLARSGVKRAVLFRAGAHASACLAHPARHFVFWPPANPPDLDAPILWANHLTVADDRKLLEEQFPNHIGFLYYWQKCNLRFVPLASPHALHFPDAPEATPGPLWWQHTSR